MQHSPTPHEDEAAWAHWLKRQPFYIDGLAFQEYAPALQLARAHWREDTLIDDVLARLGAEWEAVKGDSRLAWFEACHAVRAAWERVGTRQSSLEAST